LRSSIVSIGLALVLISTSLIAPPAAAQAERQWIVDNSATASGDGSPTAPFLTLHEAVAAAAEGDVIVLSGSAKPYAGGIALRSGQSLRGEGPAPLISASEGSVISVSDASSPVTITNVIVRASGSANGLVVRDVSQSVTLHDVRVTAAGGTALLVERASKLVVTGESSLESVDAPALRVDRAELEVALRSVSARGEKLTSGIVLQRVTGRFSVEGTEGMPGSGGTIEGAAANAVSVDDASGITLRRMRLLRSALVNGVTGAECGGNLAEGSSEGCHAAVFLRRVEGAVLDQLIVEGSGQAGLVAHRVSNMSITGSSFLDSGDELSEHGLILEEVTGQCAITGTTVERSSSRHLMLHNSSGHLSLSLARSRFSGNSATNGQQGVLLTAAGEAALDIVVSESTFSGSRSHAFEAVGTDDARLTVRLTGSTFDRNASAVSLAATKAATIEYLIADNPSIVGSSGTAINVYLGTPSSGTVSGSIVRNTIGSSGAKRSGAGCDSCHGIVLTASGSGQLIAEVGGNVIQEVGASAISASAQQGTAQLHLTATANLMRQGGASAPAIRIQSGTVVDAATVACADLGGLGARANTIEGAWDPNGAVHLVHRFGGTRFAVAGLSGARSDTAAAAAVSNRNGGAKVRAVLRPESTERGFDSAERCTMPSITP
jgi:hypothetical protein